MEDHKQVVQDLLAERQRLIASIQELETEERRLRAELEAKHGETGGSATDSD